MKYVFGIIFFLVASIATLGNNNNVSANDNKVIAIFNEVTEDGLYKFTDEKNNIIYFNEISLDVDIDLDDEVFIDSKFSISWEEEKTEVLDDEGEPTGKFTTTKTITKLTEL